MEKIIVKHCNFEREFESVENAIKHAEALTQLGYDASVYTCEFSLYESKYTLVYRSSNIEKDIFSTFYNFRLRGVTCQK